MAGGGGNWGVREEVKTILAGRGSDGGRKKRMMKRVCLEIRRTTIRKGAGGRKIAI